MRRPVFMLLLAAASAAVASEPVEVISPRPDAVSVTIYRDLFALITETRTVELPAGPVRLSFDGVVETLLPASAVVADTGRELQERNFDAEDLRPNALFAKYVGREVMLTRTLPGSGKVTHLAATVVAARPGGIVLRTADGNEALHCSGLAESVTFEKIPDDLQLKPRLSVQLAGGAAGRRTVRVSYLAQGFTWKSDYVARLGESGERIDLKGWVTLRNLTNTRFEDAQVQVVAGRLNLLHVDDGGSSIIGGSNDLPADSGQLRYAREEALQELLDAQAEESEDYDGTPGLFSGCEFARRPAQHRPALPRPPGREAAAMMNYGEIDEVIVTGMRGSLVAQRENLADYQLYRLPWRTDLAARQTKQAVFLDKRAVKVERFYGMRFDAFDGAPDIEDASAPILFLGFENRKSSGLGEPLPDGVLRLFEAGPAGDLFSGEGSLDDTAVDVPVEIALAGAVDLALEVSVERDHQENRLTDSRTEIALTDIRIANAKGVPVTVEIRQTADGFGNTPRITRASQRTLRKHGDYAWRVRVPANSAGTLRYEIRYVADD